MPLPIRVFLVMFGLVFVTVGSGVLVDESLRPAWQLGDAQGWTERTCTITSSAVEHWLDNDGDHRYRVSVAYVYQVDGATHHGQRYSFGDTSSSRSVAEDTVARLSAGTGVPCWVDPGDAGDAVLVRTGFSPWFGLMGLVFQLGGTAAIAAAWSAARPRRPRVRAGALLVRPTWRTVLFVAAVALLVAAQLIVTAIGLVRATLWLHAAGYLAAAALATALGAHRLGQWATGLHLEITPPALALGQHGQIRWTLRAPFGLASGSVRLVGREVVVIGSGSDTTTRTHTFHDVKLADLTSRQAAAPIAFAMPAGHSPSFVAGNASVEWGLAVHVELPRWPDLDLTVPVEVEPAPSEVPRPRPPRLDPTPPPAGEQLELDATALRPGAAITGVVGWRRNVAPTRATVELRRHVEILGETELHTEVVAAVDIAVLERVAGAGLEAAPYRGLVQAGVVGPTLDKAERRELYLVAPRGPLTHTGELLRVGWSLALVVDGTDQITCDLAIRA